MFQLQNQNNVGYHLEKKVRANSSSFTKEGLDRSSKTIFDRYRVLYEKLGNNIASAYALILDSAVDVAARLAQFNRIIDYMLDTCDDAEKYLKQMHAGTKAIQEIREILKEGKMYTDLSEVYLRAAVDPETSVDLLPEDTSIETFLEENAQDIADQYGGGDIICSNDISTSVEITYPWNDPNSMLQDFVNGLQNVIDNSPFTPSLDNLTAKDDSGQSSKEAVKEVASAVVDAVAKDTGTTNNNTSLSDAIQNIQNDANTGKGVVNATNAAVVGGGVAAGVATGVAAGVTAAGVSALAAEAALLAGLGISAEAAAAAGALTTFAATATGITAGAVAGVVAGAAVVPAVVGVAAVGASILVDQVGALNPNNAENVKVETEELVHRVEDYIAKGGDPDKVLRDNEVYDSITRTSHAVAEATTGKSNKEIEQEIRQAVQEAANQAAEAAKASAEESSRPYSCSNDNGGGTGGGCSDTCYSCNDGDCYTCNDSCSDTPSCEYSGSDCEGYTPCHSGCDTGGCPSYTPPCSDCSSDCSSDCTDTCTDNTPCSAQGDYCSGGDEI